MPISACPGSFRIKKVPLTYFLSRRQRHTMCWLYDPASQASYNLQANEETFADQAPCAKGSRCTIPPLRPNSVRPDMAQPDIPGDEYNKHFCYNRKTGRDIYEDWRTTGKFVTRRAGGDFEFQREESCLLLEAYEFGLLLGATKNTSRFCDAILDAMTEYMDAYGYDHCGPWWPPLLGATEGHPYCMMLKLFGFSLVVNIMHKHMEGQETDNDEFEKC
jgi:hypothetical protein